MHFENLASNHQSRQFRTILVEGFSHSCIFLKHLTPCTVKRQKILCVIVVVILKEKIKRVCVITSLEEEPLYFYQLVKVERNASPTVSVSSPKKCA